MNKERKEVEIDGEIVALVETIQLAELRLEELIGSEVDTVEIKQGEIFFLRRAQEQIIASEARMRAALLTELRVLIDLMPGMVWFKDTQNNILRVSQRVADVAGLPLHEIEGKRSAEIYPIDSERFYIEDQIVINSGKPRLGIEEIVHNKVEKQIWVRTDKVPYFDDEGKVVGLLVVAHDISSTKETEAALRESETHMATAQRISHFGSWAIDLTELESLDRNPLSWSDEMYRIAGYLPGEIEITEELFFSLVHPDEVEPIRNAFAQSIEGGTECTIDHRLLRPDGDVRDVRQTAQVFYDENDGRPLKIVGTAYDITDRKLIEDQLQKALYDTEAKVEERTADLKKVNADLEEAVRQADLANKSKSEFLSRMSHELRTPMNSVLGYAQLLDMQYSEPRIKEAAKAILHGGKHLLEMINEVLEFASIESGAMAISQEHVNIGEVLSQATEIVGPLANAAKIQLHLNEDCLELYVLADRQRLMQVLINLLSNAIKYNREDGEIFAHCEDRGNGTSFIEVTDTGVGISETDQTKLFQPFQRFGDMGIQGTGLGLSLSQRFVGLMDGQLTLVSSTEKGSTFRIELQSAERSEENRATDTSYTAAGSLEGFHGKILYIEDNQVNIKFIEAILSSWPDIKLFTATRGGVGLEIANKHQPNLILLDLHLPDMMGDTILKQLKEREATSRLPVVMLSADATSLQIDRLKAEGASDYLTKPIDLSLFFVMLKVYLVKN